MAEEKLTRIGMFYDGGFFSVVNDYYRYVHERKARLSIDGIHRFVKHKVAEVERVDEAYCRVVDAHYFRGRFSAESAERAGKLKADRQFDDVLMRAGVVTHYLPRTPRGEKGIDVWLALEAYELAIYKRFNVLVLIACDGDYVPLARKLNTLGTRVMILGWDFKYTDDQRIEHKTVTSIDLLDEVTYPIMMHTLIDDKTLRNDPVIKGLFLAQVSREEEPEVEAVGELAMMPQGAPRKGTVKRLKKEDGYGFITDDADKAKEWFFHASRVLDEGFEALSEGDPVTFRIGHGPKGPIATDVKKVVEQHCESARTEEDEA